MRLTPRVFVTSGPFADDNRWISMLAPRSEDCFTGEEFEFLATEALHVVIFVGTGAKDVYDPGAVRDSDDARRVIDSFPKFPTKGDPAVPSYRVICYIEEGNAIENDALSGTTQYTDAVNELETQVTAICEAMSPERFEYAGRFDYREADQVREIAQTIKDHWGIT